tara:strand:- start:7227 stop:7529 length:303 start_codon:yes stop_codon:yes gene_type:complete
MMQDSQFENLKTYVLCERYNSDPSVVYSLNSDELQILLSALGELEPIVDAMNVLAGASVEQRARDIGCSPEDFDTGCDELISVEELTFAAEQPFHHFMRS